MKSILIAMVLSLALVSESNAYFVPTVDGGAAWELGGGSGGMSPPQPYLNLTYLEMRPNNLGGLNGYFNSIVTDATDAQAKKNMLRGHIFGLYASLLYRNPSWGELEWQSDAYFNAYGCSVTSFRQVTRAIYYSPEAQRINWAISSRIFSLYGAALGRWPSYGDVDFWVRVSMAYGESYVVEQIINSPEATARVQRACEFHY